MTASGHAAAIPAAVTVLPVTGIPEVTAGADLAALIADALAAGPGVEAGDVVVVTSKIASKALGLTVPAGDRAARERATASHTVRVVAERATATGVTRIVQSAAGPVMAAAGVDASNTGRDEVLLLLPTDPDAVAAAIRSALLERFGVGELVVVLSDTAGRPWRGGQTDFALGCAGLAIYDDLRGGVDADGRPLAVTVRAVADEFAAAADLVKGKTWGVPVAVVRGARWEPADQGAPGARGLVRTGPGDWFATGHVEAVRSALGVAPGSALSDSVGIRPVGADELGARIGRAVRLALSHDLPAAQGGASHEGNRVVLHSGEAFGLGYLLARLQVALASEGLGCAVFGSPEPVPDQPGRVRMTIRVTEPDADATPE